MPETSKERELEKISLELRELTQLKEQLNDRLRLLAMLREFQQNAGTHEAKNDEYDQICEEVDKLTKRKKELHELQKRLDLNSAGDCIIAVPVYGPDGSSVGNQIFVVERPPSYQAPQVILDIKQLPPQPSLTRCPHCEQHITTEVRTVVGNTTWLLCLVCTFIGCFVGCCLIPFCTNNFKDVAHKCPKCRSHIHTCTKL
ncbi:cell death-inducing p53-target protein 1-like [Trichomycterus rosablanca]|uniref:cell death-inducing p53-target protein 1-like n=1 Tax=Trichomycterus rosablanca TaxID=2290929 RepID=UPI002F35A460